jgi:outer membrane protein OmpA-like peptidoglycan-associated protein
VLVSNQEILLPQSDQQDVAKTAEAQAEIETETNEGMIDKAQRGQETSPLKSTEAQASQAQSDPSRSAEPSTVAQTSEQPEAQGSTDADGDGVADVSDKCPKTVEGAKVDEKGCAQIEQPLARLEDVLFESGKAALRPRAEETLTELVSILENNLTSGSASKVIQIT